MNSFPIHLLNDEIIEVVVPDRAVGRQHLAENDHALFSFWKKFRLKSVEIDESLGCVFLPVPAPFLEILARELLKNQATEDKVGWGIIQIIRWNHIILRRAMLQPHIESERFSCPLNV